MIRDNFLINTGMDFSIPNTGIGSVLDMRRDANMTRNNARDQYEADVADFKDSLATDLENSFMSRGDSILDTPVVSEFPTGMIDLPSERFIDLPPQIFIDDMDMMRDELSIGIDQPLNIYENVLEPREQQIQVPPPRFIDERDFIGDEIIFDDPIMDINRTITPPINDTPITPPITPPINDRPRRPNIFSPARIIDIDDRQNVINNINNTQIPDIGNIVEDDPIIVNDPVVTSPVNNTPAVDNKRPFYRPSRNYQSGVPSIAMNIKPSAFGMAPGMFPPVNKPDPVRIPIPPKFPPPPIRIPPPDDILRPELPVGSNGMRLGGALNRGIMRLPQSQQGDTMTTQIFQNGFRPRR